MVSGLPASTVNSSVWLISNFSDTISISRLNCSSLKDVGVPPPIYTDLKFLPFMLSFTKSSSLARYSIYSSAFFAYLSMGYDVKEQ